MTPLLVTTANEPPAGVPNLKMTSRANRMIAAKSAVYYWGLQGVKDIIIADATGSDLFSGEERSMLEEIGCSIEQISYQQDAQAVRQYGKGFAEGRLIEFALKNSKLLSGAAFFYKCTGKVFCRNFPQIDSYVRKNRIGNMFWVGSYTGLIFNLVDLRFFRCTPDLFHAVLLPAYLSTREGNDYVEELVTPGIRKALQKGQSIRPRLSGFSGLSSESYPETTLGDIEFSFPCYLNTAHGTAT